MITYIPQTHPIARYHIAVFLRCRIYSSSDICVLFLTLRRFLVRCNSFFEGSKRHVTPNKEKEIQHINAVIKALSIYPCSIMNVPHIHTNTIATIKNFFTLSTLSKSDKVQIDIVIITFFML